MKALVNNKICTLKLREVCYNDSMLEERYNCYSGIREFLHSATDIAGERITRTCKWNLTELDLVVFTFAMWEGEKAIVFSNSSIQFFHLNVSAGMFVHLLKNI